MAPLRVRLREVREAAGLSQLALANLAGVRQATISDLETGKSQGIDFATVDALAKALGVPPHELFETMSPTRRRR